VGPESLLGAARFDLADDVHGHRVERLADEIDEELRRAVPEVGEEFLDPSPAAGTATVTAPACPAARRASRRRLRPRRGREPWPA
jgi:hypothetical protein